MKKYTTFIFILLSLFFLTGCARNNEPADDLSEILKKGYINVGVKSDSPPFGYYKDGKRAGFDIELAKEIAAYIFNDSSPDKIQFTDVTPQNRISKLNAKDVDILVATMSVNEKRKLVINFSAPYFVTGLKLMVKKDSKIVSLNQFSAKNKLVVIMGTTGEKVARLVSPNASLIGAKSYNEAFNYLQNGQADGILGDEIILKDFLNDDYRIINRAYSREYYAVATRKQEESKELLNKINIVVAHVLDEKKIDFNKKN